MGIELLHFPRRRRRRVLSLILRVYLLIRIFI
jgi:hypothetical protein